MGSSPLIRGLNHLLCAVLGAGLFLLIVDVHPRPPQTPEAGEDTPTVQPEKDLAKDFADYRKAFRERPADPPTSSHRTALDLLGLEADASPAEIADAANLEQHRLLTRAEAYRDVADLAPQLTEALSKQETDTSLALFLAWHQRDPAGAFDELARRPDLLRWYVAASYPAMLVISTEELVSQIKRSDRSREFRESLRGHLAQRLAYRGDLPEFQRHWAAFTDGYELARAFMKFWHPVDHEKAVQEVTSTLPTSLQGDLAKSVAWQLPGPLGENPDPAAALKTFFAERRTAESLKDLNHVKEVEVPAEPDLWYFLTQEHQNYLGLFANGEISAQEVADRMQEKLAGTEHDAELSKDLYHHLGRARPAEAIAWAQQHLSPEDLAAESIRIMNLSSGPRTRRLADVVAALEPAWSEADTWEGVSTRALKCFKVWQERDPEIAAAALAKIGPDHPIWSHRKEKGAQP